MTEPSPPPDLEVRALPARVVAAMSASGDVADAPLARPDEDGRTLFDTPASEDGSVLVIFPQERFQQWRSQALVHVLSNDNRTYLAQVSRGPYAAPNGLPPNSPLLLATQVEGTVFTPPYHGWVELNVLGEVKDGTTISPLYRPRPNSPVKLLDSDQTRSALRCDGDLRLGRAVAYPDLFVGLRSEEKHHIPRHTLIVGTTGSGKSTSLAGVIEKLARAGFCVLVLDVEGEYTTIDRPADSDKIRPALAANHQEPAGIPNSYLLVPTTTATTNPDHPQIRRFCLDFMNVSPHVAVEILQGNDAQSDRFMAAYDVAGEIVTQLCPAAERPRHQQDLQAWDEQETGYPGLRLAHVLDVAQALTSVVAGDETIDPGYLHADGFRAHADALWSKARSLKKRVDHANSWRKTVGLIAALYRTGLFDRSGNTAPDNRKITSLRYAEMVKPGRVLIFDLQGVDSPRHRNLAISDVLRGVIEVQEQNYAAAPADQKPKTAIVIEEAHEFVSAERIKQMPTLFGQIQRIARRGRKRWLGLIFATQFPQHLPGELFTLCNNRILLRLGDEPTFNRLKQSVAGVPENLWNRLKNLPTGQAIVSAHGIDPAMIVALEPGACKLQMVD